MGGFWLLQQNRSATKVRIVAALDTLAVPLEESLILWQQ
jgi:exonuclease VII small subunit